MKRLPFLLLAAAVLISQPSCKKIKGDGPTVVETRNVTGFRSIRSEIDGDLHFTQSPTFQVEVHAQDNILDVLQTRVRNGELVIDYSGNENIGRHNPIDIYVSGPTLEGLAIGGSGNIEVTGTANTDRIALEVGGSGRMVLQHLVAAAVTATISGSGEVVVNRGTAAREDLTIAGSGSIDFLNMEVEDARTNTLGSGSMYVHATRQLDVTITGSGNVYYKGNPSLNASVYGSGKVRKW